jgi:hypothetical protein
MTQVALEISWDLNSQPWSDPYWAGDIPVCSGVAIPNIVSCRSGKLLESPLRIWDMPRALARYTLAIDPSSGKEFGDPAAIQIVDASGLQVAEMLLRNADLGDQHRVIEWLGYFYNEATLAIEVNSFGLILMQMIQEHKYPNIWVQGNYQGWLTTCKTRDLIISNMQKALREKRPVMRSRRLREQLQAYRGDGLPEDDLLMAMLIAYQCR